MVVYKVFNYSFTQSKHLVLTMSEILLGERTTMKALTQF